MTSVREPRLASIAVANQCGGERSLQRTLENVIPKKRPTAS
jgi:hypothetical protein